MSKVIKNIITIPQGYTVLTEVSPPGKLMWVMPEESGYSFCIAEHTDGATELCRSFPNGDIYRASNSILVRDMYCMHCGEHLTPDWDSENGTPDPYNYHCDVCGHDYEIDGEDELL